MEYIDINPIVEKAKELNCPYIAIIGGKGTGKTWGCVDYAIKDFFKCDSKRPFFYVRRYDKTFTESICGNLIRSHRQDIINLSHGKYNTARLRGKVFNFMRETETGDGLIKSSNRTPICYCRSLNNVETETVDDKGDVSCIIYDEFLSRGCELKDEFLKIQTTHANIVRNRTDRFIPFFMLGNTVSRDSMVAEQFGVRLRDIKRGLNIFENSKKQVRLLLYYTPSTSKNAEAADTYYNRFENDHINMISRGDWVLGSYTIAPYDMLFKRGVTFKFHHNRVAVDVTVAKLGYNPIIIVKRPTDCYSFRVSPETGKHNLQIIPKVVVDAVRRKNMYVETSEIGEDFRDICKHIVNGMEIVNVLD